MTKEEIAQAAEGYLMLTNHNEGTAIRDAYKAGAKLIQSENERLKAEREWISVETELPKNGQWIDVWQPETAHYRPHRVTNLIYKRSRRNTFSHWMPVPTEPKQ